MRGDATVKRALYLRGFEYQTDIAFGAGTTATILAPDSWYFGQDLGRELSGDFGLLATLAPEDVSFGWYDAKRYLITWTVRPS